MSNNKRYMIIYAYSYDEAKGIRAGMICEDLEPNNATPIVRFFDESVLKNNDGKREWHVFRSSQLKMIDSDIDPHDVAREFSMGDRVRVELDAIHYYGMACAGEEGEVAGIGKSMLLINMDKKRIDPLPNGAEFISEYMPYHQWRQGYMALVPTEFLTRVSEPKEESAKDQAVDDKVTSEDPVNSPSHYTTGGIECIEAIKASMSHEAFCGYLKGNAQKYLWRYQKKGRPSEDLSKANWYIDRLRMETGDV